MDALTLILVAATAYAAGTLFLAGYIIPSLVCLVATVAYFLCV